MKTLITLATLAGLLLALSCHGQVHIDAPTDDSDAGPDANALCEAACDVLDTVPGCSVPNCLRTCIADATQGAASQLDPACVVRAGAYLDTLRACGACQ